MKTEMDDPIYAGADSGVDEIEDTTQDDFGNELGGQPLTDEPKNEAPQDDGTEAESDEHEAPEARDDESAGQAEEVSADESDDTDDAPVEEEAEAKPSAEARSQQKIPKSRFDEVNERRKAAEKRLAELERQREASDPSKAVDFDFKDAEKRYMEAVLDGETDKALSIREEIRAAERAVYQAEVQQAQQKASEMTKAELALNEVIESAQADYPVFDGTHEAFNEDITQEAMDLYQSFQARGYDPAAAMRRAVNYTVKMHDLQPVSAQVQPQPEAPKPQQRATKPKKTVEDKLSTAAKQPPSPTTTDVAGDLDRDPMRMSEAEFDKLSADEERLLRGDIL